MGVCWGLFLVVAWIRHFNRGIWESEVTFAEGAACAGVVRVAKEC